MLILYPQGGVITMPQDKRNIYKIAREAKGLTQEAAGKTGDLGQLHPGL